MEHRAPVAQMTRKRSKINETQDFQEQADRADQARDAEDSDYHQSTNTPRKRRAPNENDSPRSSKKKSPGHQPFGGLTADSKKARKTLVRTICQNWEDDVEQWMPRSIWPCKVTKLNDNRSNRVLIEDPRDWNAPLLEELSHLSNVTRGRPAVALRALERAVRQRQQDEDDHADTQVLKEDIRVAMQLYERAEPSRPSPPHIIQGIEVDEQAEIDMPQNGAEDDLYEVRSPTFAADDVAVGAEIQIPGVRNLTENVIGGARTGFDDDMEKLQLAILEKEEFEAIAAAKRKEREVIELRRRIREQLQERGDRGQDDGPLRPE